MTKKIITISRQYGSGGREVGERVAEILRYAYYDTELINRMAQTSNIDVDFVKKSGEGIRGKMANLFLSRVTAGSDEATLPLPDRLFFAQARCIKKIAEEGPCVIIGRCADYVLEGIEGTFNVFVYADWDARVKRVMQRNDLDEQGALARIKKINRNRIAFYERYTERKWGRAENYDLSCSSSFFGINELAELIAHIAQTH